MTADLRIMGEKELIAKLNAIANPRTRRAIARKAVRAGATVVRKAWRQAASQHVHTGNLKKSIITKLKTYNQNIVAITGNNVAVARHAHLIEFGTVERFHKSGKTPGKSVGKMPALGLFRKTWNAVKFQAAARIRQKLIEEMGKF